MLDARSSFPERCMPTDTRLAELSAILLRDLDGLARQVALYPDDAAPWREIPGVPNPGGTLVLHLAGNLRHFVGATLGGTGYRRDREAEFATRGVPRAELLALVAATRREVEGALDALDPAVLPADYPLPLLGRAISTGQFLLHLAVHLGYHLGQIDTHRRAVTGDRASAASIPLTALGRPHPAES